MIIVQHNSLLDKLNCTERQIKFKSKDKSESNKVRSLGLVLLVYIKNNKSNETANSEGLEVVLALTN